MRQQRWRWRRLERKAVRAYEQRLLASLRQQADARREITSVRLGALGTVELDLPECQVFLADVAMGACRDLNDAPGGALLRLTSGGRYGRFWWVRIQNGSAPHEQRTVTLLGSQLRIATRGDAERASCPPDSPSLQRAPLSRHLVTA